MKAQKRHKCFEDSHQEMINTAVRLISEKGLESLSIAALAREMGINRTTVYYHFDSRESLIAAVKSWSSEQLAKAFSNDAGSQNDRIDYTSQFVLDNPDLIKLWIEDLISVGNIRDRYPHWDELVNGVRKHLEDKGLGDSLDVEVYCVNLISTAVIGPRIFKNSVAPDDDNQSIIDRFRHERQRILTEAALLKV